MTLLGWGRSLEEEVGDLGAGEGKNACGYVVEHDACSGWKGFELADGPGLEDVEEAEEEQGKECVSPIGWDGDEGDELAGDFVDDDVTRVFAARFVGYYRGGWNAD